MKIIDTIRHKRRVLCIGIQIPEHADIGEPVGCCYNCSTPLMVITSIERDLNRPKLIRYIYQAVYQHCVHPNRLSYV